MDIATQLENAWGPYLQAIRSALDELAHASMPEDSDFLWFVLYPQELEGIPIMVWPTERNQQQHDGWEQEHHLRRAVPDSVVLPDEFGASVEALDGFRDGVAQYLVKQWNSIGAPLERLAYFSLYDDGYYFSMRDGRKISAWDIETEVGKAAAKNT